MVHDRIAIGTVSESVQLFRQALHPVAEFYIFPESTNSMSKSHADESFHLAQVPFRLPCAQIARATDIRMVGMNATFDLRNASKWTFRGGRRFSRRGCDPQG